MQSTTELGVFVEVVQQGSFSAAARRLGLAPSVVADRISALEKRLGVTLLARTTRRQSLTEAGEDYFDAAKRILADLIAVEKRVAETATTARGTLRVTAPNPLGQAWIAPFVERFSVAHPEILIHLALEDRYADIIAEGFDVAIRGGPSIDVNLVGRHLFDTRRVVVASPAYLQRCGTPAHPEDLAAHRCLISTTQPHLFAEWRFGRGADAQKVRISGSLSSTNSMLPVSWALAGLGLAQKSWWEVADHVAAGNLMTVLDAFEPDPASFYAIHSVHRSKSKKLSLFIEGLLQSLDHFPSRAGTP
jgi:LysR family transcriptional activator of dmlA